jgi:hypothetical protein
VHGRTVVVYNPITMDGEVLDPGQAQCDGRTRSNVAHEFAHLVLRHELRQIQRVGEHTFFACDHDQEEEANWLAAALPLPRALLVTLLAEATPTTRSARPARSLSPWPGSGSTPQGHGCRPPEDVTADRNHRWNQPD